MSGAELVSVGFTDIPRVMPPDCWLPDCGRVKRCRQPRWAAAQPAGWVARRTEQKRANFDDPVAGRRVARPNTAGDKCCRYCRLLVDGDKLDTNIC